MTALGWREVLIFYQRQVGALVLMSIRLAIDGKKYAAVRLFGGALFSTFDLIADIYMIWTYYSTGENGFAIASLISLLSNIIIQLWFVFLQNRKQTRRRLFQEIMYVLTFTKPGVDSYHVMIGAEYEVGAFVDPKSEMMVVKMSELFTEAIPGALIQAYAFLVRSNQSNAAIFSLIVSVFTSSFTASGISFDFDLDKNLRRFELNFYGYGPDGAKKKVKISLFLAYKLLRIDFTY
ncbi:hypothetical protein TL16_g06476 [Triparma laevis f. inornata]|uniref:Uncharacterized protein n=1 Tax=Triparma laevis f. inornata TaxID=1714386 RepID=A0A9W7AR41_9STRA|nr:hypothetical protein TL16_g06476 [Triparma laevis f. inornata]